MTTQPNAAGTWPISYFMDDLTDDELSDAIEEARALAIPEVGCCQLADSIVDAVEAELHRRRDGGGHADGNGDHLRIRLDAIDNVELSQSLNILAYATTNDCGFSPAIAKLFDELLKVIARIASCRLRATPTSWTKHFLTLWAEQHADELRQPLDGDSPQAG